MAALKYWIWLTTQRGVGQRDVLKMLDHFVTPERIYYADPEEYELLELRPAAVAGLQDKDLSRAEDILAQCERLGLKILTLQDAQYPERLRQLADPPAVLYIRGRTFRFDEEAAIGVVGARTPTAYGERMAEHLGFELAGGGALVVSGIAEGLDSRAIRGALKAGGPVVSVLAGGIDVVFPPQHKYLYEDVAAAGALISEYPPGTRPVGHHFLQRNRILSGLCLGVVAVECRIYGGTISTMHRALEQDRDLFAVPGPADAPMSTGPNRLIQQGAKLVTCGRDILEEYWDRFPGKLTLPDHLTAQVMEERLIPDGMERLSRPVRVPEPVKEEVPQSAPAREKIPVEEQKTRFTDDELLILAALGSAKRSADELVEATQIPTRRVLSALTMLQVQGAVEEHPGRRFSALVELAD